MEGGTVGLLAVVHTWTQQLTLHPQVHWLVSGGGISEDTTTWHPARRKFLVPIKALAKLAFSEQVPVFTENRDQKSTTLGEMRPAFEEVLHCY